MPFSRRNLITLLALFSAANSAVAADCGVCTNNYIATTIAVGDLKKAQDLLDKNKRVLATVSEHDVSKRVKLASNILILTTRTEVLSTNKEAAEKQLLQNHCNVCPKPRAEEIEKALKERKENPT